MKNSWLGRDLAISVDDRGILTFCYTFLRNFAYAKFRKNKNPAKTSEFTVLHQPNIPHRRNLHLRQRKQDYSYTDRLYSQGLNS